MLVVCVCVVFCVLVLGERHQLFNRQRQNSNKNDEHLTKMVVKITKMRVDIFE